MKFHEIKLPFKIHHNLHFMPVAVSITCLLILAIVNLSDYNFLLHPHLYTPSPATSRVLKDCNIFKGEWMPDPDAPYYTNSTCSVIHGHYNCIKYAKPDLGFVKWRWRPTECELPRFEPAQFLDMMRHKSMAFLGDSLARNHMHSLICLLTQAEQPMSRTNPSLMYHKAYNFTISIFWSPYLVRAVETDPDGPAHTGSGLWNLYLDEPDAGWASHIDKFDYIVISASSWFFRPSMFYEHGRLVGCHNCLMPNVTDLTLRYSLRMAFRSVLRAVNALDGAHNRTVIVRTVSPSHYENGEWNKDGNCVRTRPFRSNETTRDAVQTELHRVQVEEFNAAEKAARGTGARMMLLDTTEAMALRPDGHPSKYRQWQPDKFKLYHDCVHWCLPGAIDVWNDMMLQMLLV